MDNKQLASLVAFARLEMDSGDIEPWAAITRVLKDWEVLSDEQAFWVVKLYNAYDAYDSAWNIFRIWPSPDEWWDDEAELHKAADWPCTQERRSLRGGRVLKHLESYVTHLDGGTQRSWVEKGVAEPEGFAKLTSWLRQIWGVGRQTAFEWAEFLSKVNGIPVRAGDAQLWESEGPRRSLQRLYGNDNPTPEWLDERAQACREFLASEGLDLSWEDFETVICDFNVMRDGRYYPGRHLAALREEIDNCPEQDQPVLMEAFRAIAPPPWSDIKPGIRKDLLPVYRNTGKIIGDAKPLQREMI